MVADKRFFIVEPVSDDLEEFFRLQKASRTIHKLAALLFLAELGGEEKSFVLKEDHLEQIQ